MESSKVLFLALCCIIISPEIILMVNGHSEPLVPAIYVFGDSTVDSGNNNHLNTVANANRWPYAIDFNNIRGRHTNGKNLADFAAIHLGLPLVPPYLNLSDAERSHIKTGINYGSGACGILNTSRVGDCLSLEKQIVYFTSTVTKDLPKQMDQHKLRHHLNKSIYLLSVGLNDYNVLANGNISNQYSPPLFADHLLDELSKHIGKLYNLGARKFLVAGVSTCEPYEYTGDHCKSRYYRDKLPERLLILQAKLPGSLFTIYDNYRMHTNMINNHEKYGITNIVDRCYNEVKATVCPDRSKYYYFDQWKHLTQVSCEIAMNECFNGTFCTPYTLFELANIHKP